MYYEPNEAFLMHYGVKGMKWGVRRANKQIYKQSVRSARSKMFTERNNAESRHENRLTRINNSYSQGGKMNRATKKAYNKAINNEWDRYTKDDAKAVAAYKGAKKQAKATYKQNMKNAKAEAKKEASLGDKLLYNNATRKQAAKYVVNNNMSMKDARTKANNVAKRNTAIILGVYDAKTVYDLMK